LRSARNREPEREAVVYSAMHKPIGVLLVMLLVVACGGTPAPSRTPAPSGTPGPSGTPTLAPSATPSASPTPSADLAVVRIEQTGGMLPPWETVSWLPSVVLYADGRLITHGPMIEIYPGPALPNLQVTQLTPQGVGQVLQAALDSGFSGPDRDIGDLVLDAGATVFTITTADGTHVTRLHGHNQGPEVAAALRFQEALLAPREWFQGAVVGEDRPFEWDRLQVLSVPMTADQMPDPALVNEVEWPLDPLADLGVVLEPGQEYRCAVIEGDDLDVLRPHAQAANQLTLFESEGETYQLRLRPLLPGEDGCQPFG
jgi:hypothetical protein